MILFFMPRNYGRNITEQLRFFYERVNFRRPGYKPAPPSRHPHVTVTNRRGRG
ncbi:MAG: hypothetical protein LBP56_10975 [Odoribacteraceae bacterium]|nr:hypothetical protein [Odoribacteraceae bacterium]